MRWRDRLLGGLVAAGALLACSEAGRSTLRVRVSADAALAGVIRTIGLRAVTRGGQVVADRTFSWGGSPTAVGLYLSDEVSGEMTITAMAHDDAGPVATGIGRAQVHPGELSAFAEILLSRLPASADAGGPGDAPADAIDGSGGSDTAAESGGSTTGPSDGASVDQNLGGPVDAGVDTAGQVPIDAASDAAPDAAVPADAASDGPGAGSPALHWRFDEEDGTAALDSSGNGFHGFYSGMGGLPTPSTSVPAPLQSSSGRSRSFTRASRQGVALVLPAALRPATALTISVWYRATDLGPAGSELVNGGDSYVLRLHQNELALLKRYGAGAFAGCLSGTNSVPGALDGHWHHVAGVISATRMNIYFDGQQVCTYAHAQDLSYTTDPELWVGQHASRTPSYDFQGNVDDVRLYTRALSAPEIGSLAAGAP